MKKITQGRLFVQPSVHLGAWPASALPHFRGTILCLAAGWRSPSRRCWSRSPTRHGAAVSGVLAWRYLVAALLLAGIAGRQDAPRSAPGRDRARSCSAPLVYALDSALFFGSLERTSAPLASLVHYAHLVLVVGVAAMIGRERLTRRRLFALWGSSAASPSSAARR